MKTKSEQLTLSSSPPELLKKFSRVEEEATALEDVITNAIEEVLEGTVDALTSSAAAYDPGCASSNDPGCDQFQNSTRPHLQDSHDAQEDDSDACSTYDQLEPICSPAQERFSFLERQARYGEQVDNRLGQLLVDFSLITRDMLRHSVETACSLGIPFGRVLVVSGWLTARHLQWAIQLQALLNNHLISKENAVKTADILYRSNFSLEDALQVVGCREALDAMETAGGRLGELLVSAEIISADQLAEAIQRCQTVGIPLGRCLVLARLVSPPFLQTAINAQKLLRERKLGKGELINALKNAHARQPVESENENCRSSHLIPTNGIRIGELLMLSNIVTEQQIQYAVEIGLLHNVPLGQVLRDLGIIDERTLDNALFLQSAVAQGITDPEGAVCALVAVHFHRKSLGQAMRETNESVSERNVLGFKDFLEKVGIATVDETREAIEIASNSPSFVCKALVFTGVIDESILHIARTCHFYAREQLLTLEDATMVLSHCQKTGSSVEESLMELGLKLKTN
jgi:hypothetical protein